MKALLILISVLFVLSPIAAQQEFVVQGTHAEYISHSVLDTERSVLVTFGYTDNTLKFWNEKTGLLYRTIDAEKSFSKLVVNPKGGKIYGLAANTIVVYSTETFKKINEYPLGRIYSIDFSEQNGQGVLTLLAQDENYMTSLYMLNEDTGAFVGTAVPPLPVDTEIGTHYFTSNGKYLFVVPTYGSYYSYNVSSRQYTELKGDYIALFDNGDVLRSIYDVDNSKLVYMRMNPETRKILWTRIIEDAILEEGIFQPTYADISFSEDNTTFWVETTLVPLTKIDITTGEVLGSFPKTESIGGVLDAGPYVYAQFGATSKFAKYKPYSLEPILEYGNNIIEPTSVVAHKGGENIELLFNTTYGKEIFSIFAHPKTTQLTKYSTNYRDDFSDGKLLLDPSSDRVFSITSTIDPIKLFNRGKAESFADYIDNYKGAQQFDFSPNTNQLAVLYKRGLRVINTKTNAETFFKPLDIEPLFFKGGFSLAPFTNAVGYVSREIQADQIMHEKLEYFDFGSKTERWSKDGRYFGVFHVNGGKELLVSNASTNTIEFLDPKSGTVLRSIPFDFQGAQSDVFLSPNEDYILYNGFNIGAVVYHLPSKKVVQKFKLGNYGNFNGSFVTNTVIAIPEFGGITFLDILTNKELLKLYLFEDESWVAYTPDGQFDGTQKGWEKVAFLKNRKTIPLESVFDQFYTPRLLHQVLASKDFKIQQNLQDFAPPPSVTITFNQGTRNLYVDDDTTQEISVETEKGTILLSAKANGDQISEIRLYQNGKLVGGNIRNLTVEDDVSRDPNTKETSITLLQGLNEFSAVAINSQGTESVPKKLNIRYVASSGMLVKPQGIQAHLLVVGIDEYQNPKYNLNYAVADATGFQESVQEGLSKITSKTHVYFIKNGEANRDRIISKLTEIASVANPQDIFIFYYAGHGVMDSKADKEFYLVPTDVTQLYGDDGGLQQKGISARELKQIASGIPAQKQLYILDACQSAGALATVAATRGAAEEKAIAQLARSTGTHWLTASGSEQFATEFDELGHGVFTYALLEAISGKADSGDKRVTVNELKAYIESRVPEISEKYKGSPQYPSSFGFGQDFPISTNQ